MIKWFPFQYKYRLSRYRDAKLIVSCECACALKSYKRVKFLRQSATSSSCCPLWKSPSSVLSSWVCPLIPGYVFFYRLSCQPSFVQSVTLKFFKLHFKMLQKHLHDFKNARIWLLPISFCNRFGVSWLTILIYRWKF